MNYNKQTKKMTYWTILDRKLALMLQNYWPRHQWVKNKSTKLVEHLKPVFAHPDVPWTGGLDM